MNYVAKYIKKISKNQYIQKKLLHTPVKSDILSMITENKPAR
ncbi:hypothetical protein BACCOPRO_03694 [Phocaeicola coprophilus DSM 18228 = JCM 13818]|uniref:Uncharacterized protein n=1 Tax=Phocaeicola coprophilus DSM 18228 = JCM 13818 TaxID=547042 RepID=S0FD34_9BACT|nr:hypothetical protein BACCOPRO_03694 [Phocaeicola coprophilus DSM 18228 = JCM 13818]